jgi:hypothetical protein
MAADKGRMRRPLLLLIVLALAGCDQLGIESPASTKARVDADGKAIGGACRHAGRAIEDCYTLNKKADKAAIFAGWREMNEYMTENKLDPVVPVIPPEPHKLPRPAKPAPSGAEDAEAEESQPIEKN